MPTGTVRLHRVLRAPPDRVYRAFLEADALARWIPPYGLSNFRIRLGANNKAHGLIETLNLGLYKILNNFGKFLVTLNYNNKCPDIRVYDQH